LHAQATGEITGTVVDPTGAVVPGVKVTAMNTATRVSRFTVTGSVGTYTIPRWPVGTYLVTAQGVGLKKGVAEGITLDVGQQRKVDFTLALAGALSSVQVNAVKTQVWVVLSVYLLVAILKKQLGLRQSLYQILQILSVTIFEKAALS
jgi:hypothetical protein